MAVPSPPICNIAQARFTPLPSCPPLFGGERWNVGGFLGSQQLAISLVRIPPGKAAFPFHNHYAIDEMFYIIEGNGDFLYGGIPRARTIAAGDIIVCRAGGPETAHQIRNPHRTRSLLYLGVSTKAVADYVEHPKSQKFCVWVNMQNQMVIPRQQSGMRYFAGRSDSAVHYFSGEPTDPLPESHDIPSESSRAVLDSLTKVPSLENDGKGSDNGGSRVGTPTESELGDPYLDYRGPPPEYKPPDNPPAFSPWAVNHDREIQFCLELLTTYPSDERIQNRLSEAYDAERDIDKTIEGWTTLVLKHSSNVRLQSKLVDALSVKGDPDHSISIWWHLLQSRPRISILRQLHQLCRLKWEKENFRPSLTYFGLLCFLNKITETLTKWGAEGVTWTPFIPEGHLTMVVPFSEKHEWICDYCDHSGDRWIIRKPSSDPEKHSTVQIGPPPSAQSANTSKSTVEIPLSKLLSRPQRLMNDPRPFESVNKNFESGDVWKYIPICLHRKLLHATVLIKNERKHDDRDAFVSIGEQYWKSRGFVRKVFYKLWRWSFVSIELRMVEAFMGNHVQIKDPMDDFPICPALWTHLFFHPEEGEGKVEYRNEWLPLRDARVVGRYVPSPSEDDNVQGLWFRHNLAVGEIIRALIAGILLAGLIGLVYAMVKRDMSGGMSLAQYVCVVPTILCTMAACYQMS